MSLRSLFRDAVANIIETRKPPLLLVLLFNFLYDRDLELVRIVAN